MGFLAGLTIGIVILVTHWPFSRGAITKALHSATSRPVRIGVFRSTYFPPGCIAENVRVLHNSDPEGIPLIRIDKLFIRGSYIGMFTSPKRIEEAKAVGMRISIPPKGSHHGTAKFVFSTGEDSIEIEKIIADGSLLEFLPSKEGDKPFRLGIEALTLMGVGSGKPWKYGARLTNSMPPGVIRASGEFGPWKSDNPGSVPASGEYTYEDVDLSFSRAVSGTLQAKGKFHGPLARLETDGSIEIPNFHVDDSGSVVPMQVTYRATVNGTNGHTMLDPVEARFLRTTLVARGPVADGVRLDLSVPRGRIEDILRLFVKDKTAPLSGAVKLDARFVWPEGPGKFVKQIRMDIAFGIAGARFRSEKTQAAIDRLSKSAQGESRKEAEADPRTMLSDLRGKVIFRDGIAIFRDVSIDAPGASAGIRGTYGLVDDRVDLHGVLHTTGSLSRTTSGFKAIVLKAVSPFFKKKENVKVVPFKITGTFKDATVSLY